MKENGDDNWGFTVITLIKLALFMCIVFLLYIEDRSIARSEMFGVHQWQKAEFIVTQKQETELHELTAQPHVTCHYMLNIISWAVWLFKSVSGSTLGHK